MLAEAEALPPDQLTRITRLRKRYSVELSAAAVELLELRRRAKSKFSDAERMYFTREGLEQATGDAIGAYHAGLFPGGVPILDACSGIGGDARHLASRGPVIAVDRCLDAAICTNLNCRGRPEDARHTVYSLCSDVMTIPLRRLRDRGVRSAFFDPSRRTDSIEGIRKRVRDAESYSPALSWMESLREVFRCIAVKVSPAISDQSLHGPDVRVEFISDRGECKEALMLFGDLANHLCLPRGASEPFFATVLGSDGTASTLAPNPNPDTEIDSVREYIYEPDPSVIRAHLLPQLASQLEAHRIAAEVPYLTADLFIRTPFAQAFRVLATFHYSMRDIKDWLRRNCARVAAVKKRNVALDPIAVLKELKAPGDLEVELVVVRKSDRTIALIVERIVGQAEPPTSRGVSGVVPP